MFKNIIELITEKNIDELQRYFQAIKIEDKIELDVYGLFLNNNSSLPDPPAHIIVQYESLIDSLYNDGSQEIIRQTFQYLVKCSEEHLIWFMFALSRKHPKYFKLFLDIKQSVHANPDNKTRHENKFLMALAAYYLVQDGLDENCKSFIDQFAIDDFTWHKVIFLATQLEKEELVSALLKKGLSVNIARYYGTNEIVVKSLLSLAVERRLIAIIKLLISKGALSLLPASDQFLQVDSLAVAVNCQDLEIIQLLIGDSKEEFNTAMLMVIKNENTEITNFLMNHYLWMIDESFQHSFFEKWLLKSAKHGQIDLFKQLIHYKSDTEDKMKMVYLELALGNNGQVAMIEWLLRDNPDLSSNDTLLPALVINPRLNNIHKVDIAAKLMELGCNPQTDAIWITKKIPLLHLVSYFGNDRLLQLFVDKKVKLDQLSDFGESALQYALMSRNISTIKYLFNHAQNQIKISHGTVLSTCFETSELIRRRNLDNYKKNNLDETILFALSLPSDINSRFNFISSNSFSWIEMTALHALLKECCTNSFLIRLLLEGGADAALLTGAKEDVLDIILDSELEVNLSVESQSQSNLQKLYVIGLLVDFGAKINVDMLWTQIRLRKYTNYRAGGKGYDNSTWPGIHAYFYALEFQRCDSYDAALTCLSAYVNNRNPTPPSYIWCRLGIINQHLENYVDAFESFMKANNPARCRAGETLDCINELVTLFTVWQSMLEETHLGGDYPQEFNDLLDLILTLPTKKMTSSCHFKMAQIYLHADGLTFSERRDFLISHFNQVTTCGKERDIAENYLKNLLTPENNFKHGLDQILNNSRIDHATKNDILIGAFKNAPEKLKSCGLEFMIKHEVVRQEKLVDVIKVVRHQSVVSLLNKSDSLLAEDKHKDALDLLTAAKYLPLYSMLKEHYFFKKQTKASNKIEMKISSINPSPGK